MFKEACEITDSSIAGEKDWSTMRYNLFALGEQLTLLSITVIAISAELHAICDSKSSLDTQHELVSHVFASGRRSV